MDIVFRDPLMKFCLEGCEGRLFRVVINWTMLAMLTVGNCKALFQNVPLRRRVTCNFVWHIRCCQSPRKNDTFLNRSQN